MAIRSHPPGSQTPQLRRTGDNPGRVRSTTRKGKRQWAVIGSDERTMASYLGQAEVPCQTLPLRASRAQRAKRLCVAVLLEREWLDVGSRSPLIRGS